MMMIAIGLFGLCVLLIVYPSSVSGLLSGLGWLFVA
jgi:hypothetical protein